MLRSSHSSERRCAAHHLLSLASNIDRPARAGHDQAEPDSYLCILFLFMHIL